MNHPNHHPKEPGGWGEPIDSVEQQAPASEPLPEDRRPTDRRRGDDARFDDAAETREPR